MAFLEIKNLTKKYGAVAALKNINISVPEGGFLVLVGPSGCGKSTLLNAIAGLESISSGEIQIDGKVINGLHPSQRDIAMVFQSYALYPNMNVEQNIAFGMEMRKIPKAQRRAAVKRVAETLHIDTLLQRKPRQLSGGQRQRVAMGRALVRDPQVFLFDEPLSNLDAKLRVDMRTEIKRLHQRLQKTICYVTHDQIEAMTLASVVAVIRDGELQQFGTPQQIYNNPSNLFVAEFMGSPAMNLIPARIDKITTRYADLAFANDAGGQQINLRLPLTTPGQGLSRLQGNEVVFGIRPEAISESASKTSKTGKSDANNASLNQVVEVVEPAGSDTFVMFKLGGKEVAARMHADFTPQVGDKVDFSLNMKRALLFDPVSQQRLV